MWTGLPYFILWRGWVSGWGGGDGWRLVLLQLGSQFLSMVIQWVFLTVHMVSDKGFPCLHSYSSWLWRCWAGCWKERKRKAFFIVFKQGLMFKGVWIILTFSSLMILSYFVMLLGNNYWIFFFFFENLFVTFKKEKTSLNPSAWDVGQY